MITQTTVRKICFSCDLQGQIKQVLNDDYNIFLPDYRPQTFFDTVTADSRIKAIQFWNILLRDSAAFDVELNMLLEERTEAYKFSGFIHADEAVITIARQDEALEQMYDELMRMLNEQQNQLRTTQKTLSTAIKAQKKADDHFLLNDFTTLNNELINTQRELIKKNAEITNLNMELQLANTNLEQFAYVASHDMNEPLRMIVSFMGRLKTKYGSGLDEKANTYMDFAIDGGIRMQLMIADLLELSRTGRGGREKEKTDLNDLFAIVKDNLRSQIAETGAQVQLQSALPVLSVYPNDIQRLLQNLISNAIKFGKPGVKPVITIDATEEDYHWQFVVQDNGIGIDAEHYGKIFEIFARLHDKTEYKGTGIGLAIVKKAIEHHGGKIWVESTAGDGSRFCFRIPK